ncbi:MAG TPA: adenylyl-sulfate kinase, partial [Candidatus Acidoferrales bacterium]|nr:adenylyl-sulfate kinase [Candidatus Acidoferrales bacterium]
IVNEGFVIWLTGLSGAGKTTIAGIIEARLRAARLNVESLDGDVVRTNLSKGLGFSREDRDTNIRRIGFVAHLLARNGVAVICSAISPYRATRDEVRALVGPQRFIEVYADCPLEVCATRPGKVEMYERARRGELKEFTGVSDPYEPPPAPAIHLQTDRESARQTAQRVLDHLSEHGFVDVSLRTAPDGVHEREAAR